MNLENIWYNNKNFFSLALVPLAGLFCLVVKIRQYAYKREWITSKKFPIPIIVVGNITVGGTGKTPLVIWLAKFLKKQGFKPGIISRGYGGSSKSSPQAVFPDSDPQLVGDEPVLIARHSRCPVAVAPKRSLAVEYLLDKYDCNLIISDDGLQHYALKRDIEIAVVDAKLHAIAAIGNPTGFFQLLRQYRLKLD